MKAITAALFRNLIRKFYNRQIWYGDIPKVFFREKLTRHCFRISRLDKAVLWLNHLDTQRILDDFPEVDIPFDGNAVSAGTEKLISDEIRPELTESFIKYVSGIQRSPVHIRPWKPEFTIAIPFYAHLDHLKSCLESVAIAIGQVPDVPAEVLIVNDDPRFSYTQLSEAAPEGLRSRLRILSNRENSGICATLNRAVGQARYAWILHLDCDDMLTPDCLKTLKARIEAYPRARYISTQMLDVGHNGELLRCRLRHEKPSELITRGMIAGHLKVIRKDLFQDIGGYLKKYEGCQDYEFALRASLFEPLLFIPDYLYKYRWHGNTQSVSRARRQMNTTEQIISTYLAAGMFLSSGPIFFSLKFKGRYAVSWQNAFENKSGTNTDLPAVEIDIRSPFNEKNRTLFAIHLSRYLERHPDPGKTEGQLIF